MSPVYRNCLWMRPASSELHLTLSREYGEKAQRTSALSPMTLLHSFYGVGCTSPFDGERLPYLGLFEPINVWVSLYQ
jgi:hypothetical protein